VISKSRAKRIFSSVRSGSPFWFAGLACSPVGLIGVFGLGMTNVAGYNALQQSIGAVWAATAMAILDFAIAAIVAQTG
jgi:hypothetical protein